MSLRQWCMAIISIGVWTELQERSRRIEELTHHHRLKNGGLCTISRCIPTTLRNGHLVWSDMIRCTPQIPYIEDPNIIHQVYIIIPGNPGLVDFYWTMCQQIFEHHNGQCWVLCIGHAGHSTHSATNDKMISYEDQIEAKELLLREAIPWLANKNAKVTLTGHSVGARICLELMHRMDDISFYGFYGLCPTVVDIADSPNGLHVTPLLDKWWLRKLLPIVLSIVSALLKILPYQWRIWIAHKIMQRNGDKVDIYFAAIALRLLDPHVLRNIMDMAHGEMKRIRDTGKFQTVINRYGKRICFFLSEVDGWCDDTTVAKMKASFPNASYHYLPSIQHAFCLSHQSVSTITQAKLVHNF